MDDFVSHKNIGVMNIACRNMIRDKFKVNLEENELYGIIDNLIDSMKEEFLHENLNTNELNNIVLSRVKEMLLVQPKQSGDVVSNENKLNDDMINIKLRELESRRQIIPEFPQADVENTRQFAKQNLPIQQNPISITLPKNKKEDYKTLIINSIKRDWIKQPFRNNIKFNISQDLHNNIFYPECILLPRFVRNITPYVLMNISDGEKIIYYSFTCCNSDSGHWNKWVPVDNPENISLSSKTWSIKLFDFTNNELDIGKDLCKITQVHSLNDSYYRLTSDTKIKGDMICLLINNEKHIYRTISHDHCEDNTFTLEKEEFTELDFIDASILDVSEQFSFIMKYCYKFSG